jgi:hypothetical protein
MASLRAGCGWQPSLVSIMAIVCPHKSSFHRQICSTQSPETYSAYLSNTIGFANLSACSSGFDASTQQPVLAFIAWAKHCIFSGFKDSDLPMLTSKSSLCFRF